MILLDTNLLVYAWIRALPQHAFAKAWLDGRFRDRTRIGIPWETSLSFLRIVTNPRIFAKPAGIQEAWRQVEEWLGADNVWVPLPTERHSGLLRVLIEKTGAAANLLPDAHLAALAISHGLTLCSTDGDFARFPGLQWVNPLVS